MERKTLKKNAKKVLSKHYILIVLLCFITAFTGGTGYSDSIDLLSQYSSDYENDSQNSAAAVGGVVSGRLTLSEVLKRYEKDNGATVKKESDQLTKDAESNSSGVLGRQKGVLASVVNGIASGSFYVTALSGIISVTGSQNIVIALFTILSLIAAAMITFLIKNVYSVIQKRMILEAGTYKKVPLHRALFLFRVRKWLRTAWNLLVTDVLFGLWSLTIVGIPIKFYAYRMVPYILAENPDIKALEVITLSRKMMKGHKWECFVLDLSFIGWIILSFFTAGILEIFYVNPYREATMCEYFKELRRNWINQGMDGAEVFRDRYLYEVPEDEVIAEAYGDAIAVINEPFIEAEPRKGILGFIENIFGVTFGKNKEQQEYEKQKFVKYRNGLLKDVVNKEVYPGRLYINPDREKVRVTEGHYYLRTYSVWNLILMFFIFAFIGWLWEVSLHLISDGEFVNRGVNHGPWLPIYGTGGILILVVLNKFRNRPALEFLLTIVLCGVVEYFTAYSLEMSHDGMKWWDYSGYFLNLDGRICAEGLLVFGLGGIAIVYLVAPALDDLLRRIPIKISITICVILLSVYLCDYIYSQKHPNMGKGITDYEETAYHEERIDEPAAMTAVNRSTTIADCIRG